MCVSVHIRMQTTIRFCERCMCLSAVTLGRLCWLSVRRYDPSSIKVFVTMDKGEPALRYKLATNPVGVRT